MSDILLESSALVANVQVIIQSHVTWPTSNIKHFKLDTSPLSLAYSPTALFV